MEGSGTKPVAVPAWRALERKIGMSTSGLLTLVVVAAVLVVISLPRLKSFARRENERDALQAATLLARQLPAAAVPDADPHLDELARGLLRQLPDTEVLEAGQLLRRHGYVFTVRRLAPPPPAKGEVIAAEKKPAPLFAVHAWPWEHGPTGSVSYLALADGRVYRSDNRGGRWSGMQPSVAHGTWSWEGWNSER